MSRSSREDYQRQSGAVDGCGGHGCSSWPATRSISGDGVEAARSIFRAAALLEDAKRKNEAKGVMSGGTLVFIARGGNVSPTCRRRLVDADLNPRAGVS